VGVCGGGPLSPLVVGGGGPLSPFVGAGSGPLLFVGAISWVVVLGHVCCLWGGAGPLSVVSSLLLLCCCLLVGHVRWIGLGVLTVCCIENGQR